MPNALLTVHGACCEHPEYRHVPVGAMPTGGFAGCMDCPAELMRHAFTPANPPSAAPLDLDALERLAKEARDTMAEAGQKWLDGALDSAEANAKASRASGALLLAVKPDVILALVAAARRGVEDTAREDTALLRIAEQIEYERRHGNENFAADDALILRQFVAARAHQEDTARIEWLEKHANPVHAAVLSFPAKVRDGATGRSFEAESIREAIDAARAHPPIQETDDDA